MDTLDQQQHGREAAVTPRLRISWGIYLAAAAITAISFTVSLALPTDEIYRTIVATPGVASLLGVLYQVFRDQAQFEKQLIKQQQQQVFDLSISSHMAEVAFEKHVTFCEQYLRKMNEIILDLCWNGPTELTLQKTEELRTIRQYHTAWLLPDTTAKLLEVENLLAQIGIALQELEGDVMDDNAKAQLRQEMYRCQEQLVGSTCEPGQYDEGVQAHGAMAHLQEVLGIAKLTRLRQGFLNRAIDELDRMTTDEPSSSGG